MNEEYTKYFNLYHKERILFSSGKTKYKKCSGCETTKTFMEKENELTYSCGSADGDGGECGDQFKIELPIYKDYFAETKRLSEIIHGSFEYSKDIKHIENYELEKLNKFMDVKDKLEETKEKIDKSSSKLEDLRRDYIKQKSLKERFSKIQELYILKKKENNEKLKIMKELQDLLTTDDRKRELRKEYAKTIYDNQRAIYGLMEELKEESSDYVKIKDETIEVFNKNLDFKDKTEKKKEKKDKKEKKTKKKEITLDDLNDEGYSLCKELSEKKLTDKEIKEKRETIHEEVSKEAGGDINIDNFKDVLKDTEMKMLFNLYDKYFFDDKLDELSQKNNCRWVVCWNNRCIKSAGLTRCKIGGTCKVISIELASQVFNNVIKKMISEKNDFISMDKKNKCDSILSCLMLTFEHELVHALQGCFCPHWSTNNTGPGDWSGKKAAGGGHSKTFMSILSNIFGHVDYQHDLFSPGDKKRKEELEDLREEERGKGLGDELEEFQVNLIKGVTLADQRNKEKREKEEKKSKKKEKPKKLTKEGKRWVKGAVKDMKEREK